MVARASCYVRRCFSSPKHRDRSIRLKLTVGITATPAVHDQSSIFPGNLAHRALHCDYLPIMRESITLNQVHQAECRTVR